MVRPTGCISGSDMRGANCHVAFSRCLLHVIQCRTSPTALYDAMDHSVWEAYLLSGNMLIVHALVDDQDV